MHLRAHLTCEAFKYLFCFLVLKQSMRGVVWMARETQKWRERSVTNRASSTSSNSQQGLEVSTDTDSGATCAQQYVCVCDGSVVFFCK